MGNSRAFILFVLLTFSTAGVFAMDEPVVANPAVNDGPLQNPLKGFHIGFDASCCPEFRQEVYFGNFMATVGYQNFKWADLEPEDDLWNWDKVDLDLRNSAGSKQKHVIVQLNAEWTRGDRGTQEDDGNDLRTPQWFLDDPRFEENVDEVRGYRSHKYESAFYQEEVKEFIAEFIHRFKDDPRIFIIQMGMVGYFGEFNVFPNDEEWLPEEIKILFAEHYRDHMFGEVERNAAGDLVAVKGSGSDGNYSSSYNGFSAVTQARYPGEIGYNIPTDGIGYTNGWINIDAIPGDGKNDDDIGNKDFNDPIDEIVTDDERKLWELGPVGGEWPPNREPTIEGVIEEWTSFWGSSDGEDYIERGHYSFARPPQVDTISKLLSDELIEVDGQEVGDDNWRLVPRNWNFFAADSQQVGDAYEGTIANNGGDLFRKWHRMMGYNYQLSNIQHSFSANKSRINISFDVDNVGLAPFYFDWNVEFAIVDAQNNVVQLIPVKDADMRTWKTDEVSSVSASVGLDCDIDQATSGYRIALRMSQPGATEAKDEPWALDSRVTYVIISNDVVTIDGSWDDDNKLVGGWNILNDVELSDINPSCDFCFPIKAANAKIATICL